jgi:hypothetical protein
MMRGFPTRLLLLLTLAAGFSAAQATTRLEGNWWASVSKSEQTGFVSGYIDCSDAEVPHTDFPQPFETFRRNISEYYQGNPSARDQSVGDVFMQVAGNLKRPPASPEKSETASPREIPEVWTPSEFFSGQYWAQADDEEKLGHIEGYLWCHEHRAKRRTGVFSKSAVKYRQMINNWYFDDPTGDRMRRPISKVLYLFRDHARTSKPHNQPPA